jgi:hypothetical protein
MQLKNAELKKLIPCRYKIQCNGWNEISHSECICAAGKQDLNSVTCQGLISLSHYPSVSILQKKIPKKWS